MNRCAAILLAASLLSGCATWDYTYTPAQQAYTSSLIAQSAYAQQERQQQYNDFSAEMMRINQANQTALQNQLAQTHAAQWQARQNQQTQQQLTQINRRLDALQWRSLR